MASKYQDKPNQLHLKHVFQNKRLSTIEKALSPLSLQQLDQRNEEQDLGQGIIGLGAETTRAAKRREQSQSILLERRLQKAENQ